MAPFGKNFLKARLKNRTKDAEPVVGKEIQVSVCKEEKVVCGVTKHTTCADMIQALLDDHKSIPESKRLLHGEPKDFCLVERWKGFERALPPLTRILRLWYAWGDQRPSIQFVLVKTSDFVPQPVKKGVHSKGAKPKRWEQHGRSQYAQSIPPERQKRMVKKAFRKLEKIHKESKSCAGADEVDRMVQLILNQDHTIREQIEHMRELDLDIERFHLQAQKDAESDASQLSKACGQSGELSNKEQLQEKLLYTVDGVQQIELQVLKHQELILKLSQDIDAEIRKAHFEENGEQEGATASASWLPLETDEEMFYRAELERLQEELNCSLFAGVSLHNQSSEIDKQLMLYESTLVSKDQECWQLTSHLSSLQIGGVIKEEEEEEEEQQQQAGAVDVKCDTQQCGIKQPVKLKPSLSPEDIPDTDSDTGISSTHSQDSLSPCLDFPPPLDTDV